MWGRFIKDTMIPHSLPWCEEDSSKMPWFLILCPDCAPSHLLSSQRSKALCVWLNSSPRYQPPTLIHCRRGLLFGLRSLPFILRAKYQYCSHCAKCSESKVALAILSESAVRFLKFLHWLFFTFKKKNTYTFPLRGRYPLILQEIETVPSGTAS